MRKIACCVAAAALVAMSPGAGAAPISQVQLNFAEAGFPTVLSPIFDAGQDINYTQTFGGYTLLISGDSDNINGPSALGDNPFLSLSVQISNVGPTPPAPLRIGMSITGLSASPGNVIPFNSFFTGIFATASTANFHTYFDPSDVLFGRAEDLSRFDGLSKQSNSNDQTVTENISSDYSMTIFVTVTPVANAHPSLNSQLEVEDIAEPGSLTILGMGVAGLALRRRNKRETCGLPA